MVGGIVEFLALSERGWFDVTVERRIWRQLTAAFGASRVSFVPEDFVDIAHGLNASPCTPVFLIPGDDGQDLATFAHPRDAVYVLGNAHYGNRREAVGHQVVRIATPNDVDFFGMQAAAIVLYDREVKSRGH